MSIPRVPCERDGTFTLWPEEKAPVCLTVKDAGCTGGDLQDGKCLSRADPCETEKGYRPTKDGQCMRSLPIQVVPPETCPVFSVDSSPPRSGSHPWPKFGSGPVAPCIRLSRDREISRLMQCSNRASPTSHCWTLQAPREPGQTVRRVWYCHWTRIGAKHKNSRL